MITRIRMISGYTGMFLMALFFMNCGPSTSITGSYINPDAPKDDYNTILVAALTPNIVTKKAVELSLVEELRKEGITAKPSMEVFPPNFMNDKPTKEEVLNKVRAEKMGGVLTVALLDTEEETRYVPGSTAYAPYPRYGYYGSFGGYYGNYYPTVYDPGYYTTNKSYFIENNLYNTESEELVWSAQSKTYDPSNVETAARGFARAVVAQMKQDGLIN